MVQSNFWCLGSPDSTARLADWDDEMDTETVICPIDEGHPRGGKRLTDLSVVLPGGAVQDFVWIWGSEGLVQDHVLKLFKANGLTGYQVKPVKARFKRASAQEPPVLWEIVVTGWAGIAPPESGIRLVEHCPACGFRVYSAWTNPERLIDSSQWDGSDFFIVWPLTGHIFITDRAADVIRGNRLSGAVLTPSTDLAFPQSVIPQLSPGRLSYSMPEDRARELGAALGID
jgi:hypothetical protein